MTSWYYKFAGQSMGPVSATEIRILIGSGQLSYDTLVWCEARNRWDAAGSIEELREVQTAQEGTEPQPARDTSTLEVLDSFHAERLHGGPPSSDETATYSFEKRKLLQGALAATGLVIGSAFIAWHLDDDKKVLATLLYVLAVLFTFFGGRALVRWFANTPALILTEEGFILPSYSADLIPWGIVREIDRMQSRRSDVLTFRLDADAAKDLRLKGIGGFVQRVIGWTQAAPAVAISHLRANPDSIIVKVDRFLERTRRRLGGVDELSEMSKGGGVVTAAFPTGQPLTTYVLMAILVAVYGGELVFGVDPSVDGAPTLRTLHVLGGTFWQSVFVDGQWWRLFTAPLLHGSVLHLGFNLLAFWFAGTLLERLIGWRWFAALFFASALGGSIGSLSINSPNLVGVGASGGIVGLFAAVIVASFHYPAGGGRTQLQIAACRILVPSLLPLVGTAKDGSQIDYAGHFGGAITGALVMLVLLRLWTPPSVFPRFGRAAMIFNGVFVAIVLLALFPITLARQLIVEDPFRNFFSGRYSQAATSFAALSEEGGVPAPYYRLWRYVSQTRAADPKALGDLRNAAAVTQKEWPYPVFSLFLGEATEEGVKAQAATSDQKCEATFYTGEWYLIRGEADEARNRFALALSSCPKTFMEYDGAMGELGIMAGLNKITK